MKCNETAAKLIVMVTTIKETKFGRRTGMTSSKLEMEKIEEARANG
jgi:hypothetical protein